MWSFVNRGQSRSLLLFYVGLIVTVLLWACGDDSSSTFDGGQSQDGTPNDSTSSGSDVMFGGDGGFLDGASGTLTIVPANQVVNVTYGQQTPTVQFSAILWGIPCYSVLLRRPGRGRQHRDGVGLGVTDGASRRPRPRDGYVWRPDGGDDAHLRRSPRRRWLERGCGCLGRAATAVSVAPGRA